MKHFIWMLCGIFISGLLLGTLSACGADQFSTAVITTTKQAPAPETEVPMEVQDEDTARRLAYGQALWDMYLRGALPACDRQGALPAGDRLEWADLESASKNQFAIADVDGDGEEELVVYWTNACMAGMRGIVFGFRDGAVHEELSEFPDLTFYEGGAVTAGWSHNQGWAGRFWPYTLYRYSEDSGVYEEIAAVDAWDLSCTEGDEVLTGAFLQEADADGDGLVYYILTGEWYQNDRTPSDGRLDGRLWDTDPVDGPALEEWLNSYTGGAEPLKIPYRHMEDIAISALGYPKPDVTYPEPVG